MARPALADRLVMGFVSMNARQSCLPSAWARTTSTLVYPAYQEKVLTAPRVLSPNISGATGSAWPDQVCM